MGAKTETYLTPAEPGLALGSAAWSAPQSPEFSAAPVTRARLSVPPSSVAPSAPSIQVVLFDVDDVLYDASSWERWLAQMFARLSPRSEADFAEAWQDVFLPTVHRGEQDFHAALAGCLKAIGLAARHIDEIVAASRGQRRKAQTNVRPFPAVRTTLTRLQSAGIGRAVLANTDRSAQTLRMQLDRLRLTGLFDQVLTSTELSASLTDVAAFSQALQVVNCAAEEAIFVTHHVRALSAAQSAGLRTAGFNVRQGACGAKCIDRFEELLFIVLAQVESTEEKRCAG
ncbi:MAG TPA: HAD family hydrolase [Pirellulales bacterium]|nr:HAD family hydrolase [Pirellulales bacterium]